MPAPDFFGDAPPLVIRLWDGADGYIAGEGRNILASIGSLSGFSNAANLLQVTATITSVNDAPSFNASDPPIRPNDGLIRISGLGNLTSPGPVNENT